MRHPKRPVLASGADQMSELLVQRVERDNPSCVLCRLPTGVELDDGCDAGFPYCRECFAKEHDVFYIDGRVLREAYCRHGVFYVSELVGQ